MLMQCIKTRPNEPEYSSFTAIVNELYDSDSYRHILGFDPIDTHLEGCYAILSEERTLARFTLYTTPGLELKGKKAIAIGSYECVDDDQVAEYTLDNAIALAKSLGAKYIIGPMEGATWNNYRFTDHIDKQPPFFMEPYHKSYYIDQFMKNEFDVIAKYTSNIDTVLSFDPLELKELESQFLQEGFKLRNLDLDHFEKELDLIADFCNTAFRDNFLFTEIEKPSFIEKYKNQRNKIDKDFFLIAENEKNDIVGIFFPIHDYMDKSGKRFILKTMARRKDIGFQRMVKYLGQKTIKKALELGYEEVIHAFVHDNNVSQKISSEFHGNSYKTHSLFARKV
jgi:hypothetical protein